MNPYIICPTFQTPHFTIRLIKISDNESLFECYNDKKAVRFMNDDNCDFGFYVDSHEKMKETVGYWLEFYKSKAFIRFAIVDTTKNKTIGTIEGFADKTGVLRVDIMSTYEKTTYLKEIFDFATENFYELFGNEFIVTKAIQDATQRRYALTECSWKYIDKFRDFNDYYQIKTKIR